MEEMEISEIAVRLKDFNKVIAFTDRLEGLLSKEVSRQGSKEGSKEVSKQGSSIYEVHSWEKLSPFYNIARMIDIMTFFIRIMLIAIVLISIMNVMIMAVYERIREIGTIAAIGTLPGKILSMFVVEGFCLGLVGAVAGTILGLIIMVVINHSGMTFNFGRQILVVSAAIDPMEILMISGIVIVISVIASLQPAFKASRMEPITALRHV